jgi:uncharacterized membrane protein YebE (DUF533 family)
MNLQNLLNEFIGGNTEKIYKKSTDQESGIRGMTGKLSNSLGLGSGAGFGKGAVIGGVAALLIGNKKARKFAGSAAKIGGAALLGGLAFKAVKNWHGSRTQASPEKPLKSAQYNTDISSSSSATFEAQVSNNTDFQLVLIKAMIAAAKADGHINIAEQDRIFSAVDNMDSADEYKSMMMDLLRYPVTVEELAESVHGIEQKTELYLISCFAVDMANEAEWEYLKRLEITLQLPSALAGQLREQALNPALEAA